MVHGLSIYCTEVQPPSYLDNWGMLACYRDATLVVGELIGPKQVIKRVHYKARCLSRVCAERVPDVATSI